MDGTNETLSIEEFKISVDFSHARMRGEKLFWGREGTNKSIHI